MRIYPFRSQDTSKGQASDQKEDIKWSWIGRPNIRKVSFSLILPRSQMPITIHKNSKESAGKKSNKWKLALSDIKMFYRFSIIITLLREL